MSKKIFVLRLNTLLSSIDSTLRFGDDNEIVIPMVVWQELKNYKDIHEKRRIAKDLISYIESLDDCEGLFSWNGAVQENGSILKIAKGVKEFSSIINERFFSYERREKEIFQTCLNLQRENPDVPVILISKNAATRTEAKSIGIEAQDFEADLFPKVANQYSGRDNIFISKESMDKFHEVGYIDISEVYEFEKKEWICNEFLEMKDYETNSSALARFDGEKIVRLYYGTTAHPFGIEPKNVGQKFFLECLMTSWEQAPLVIAKGGAGTGKTYCALAYSLQYNEENPGTRILVATPSETVGQEKLGFLPGNINRKFTPYLGGIKDNLSALINPNRGKNDDSDYYEDGEYFFEKKILELQPIGFLRGRTIMNSIFIIDETQNIDPGDIKSIVTRAAEGSKFIFLGDPTQVDNPKLNERYNGLVYLSEKMKSNPMCYQVTLTGKESVRSKLSTEASIIL